MPPPTLLAESATLPRLRCVLVAHRGATVAERCHRGPGPDTPVNIKSVSKSVISALVGIAIAEGKLSGVDQPIGPFFARYLDARSRPAQARDHDRGPADDALGLERTSGEGYGALGREPELGRAPRSRARCCTRPARQMLYSTGNTHLLSAILTRRRGRARCAYAQQKLARPLGIRLDRGSRDPQGIYFGGNQMRLSPRALLRFGELYRNGGRHDGRQVVPARLGAGVARSRARARPSAASSTATAGSSRELRGHRMFYAWGYGGQFIFVVPDLELTVVTTSDPTARATSSTSAASTIRCSSAWWRCSKPAVDQRAGERAIHGGARAPPYTAWFAGYSTARGMPMKIEPTALFHDDATPVPFVREPEPAGAACRSRACS